jgi:hypothetical protein
MTTWPLCCCNVRAGALLGGDAAHPTRRTRPGRPAAAVCPLAGLTLCPSAYGAGCQRGHSRGRGARGGARPPGSVTACLVPRRISVPRGRGGACAGRPVAHATPGPCDRTGPPPRHAPFAARDRPTHRRRLPAPAHARRRVYGQGLSTRPCHAPSCAGTPARVLGLRSNVRPYLSTASLSVCIRGWDVAVAGGAGTAPTEWPAVRRQGDQEGTWLCVVPRPPYTERSTDARGRCRSGP